MPTTKENKDMVCSPNGPMHAYTMNKINALVGCINIINMRRTQIPNEISSNIIFKKCIEGWVFIIMPLVLVGHCQ
jgi:hypothetical protein